MVSWVKYAAIVILAVGLGWGIHAFYGKVESSYLAEENVVYNEIHVRKGGRANTVILSDGNKSRIECCNDVQVSDQFQWEKPAGLPGWRSLFRGD